MAEFVDFTSVERENFRFLQQTERPAPVSARAVFLDVARPFRKVSMSHSNIVSAGRWSIGCLLVAGMTLAGCASATKPTTPVPQTSAPPSAPSRDQVVWHGPQADAKEPAPAPHDVAKAHAADAHEVVAGVTPAEALKKLREGNARFVSGKPEHPDQSNDRRSEVAKGQHPYAIILSCSDSRVPPELVFDAGLGDLFIVRVAGNTADDSAIGSIEYAVEHLGANLIVVLGHERCGAVKAAVDSADSTAAAPGHLAAVLDPIAPSVKEVKGKPGDIVDLAVRANVARVVAQLKASKPVLADLVSTGKLQIIGGRYDLETGEAELK